ncbi:MULTISPECIES: S24 family peptidase [Klebsiella]|uniref:S24 family peptidase n=1 Tax=Klebsiella TaxID=570 RepID=UPI000C99F21E|nr:MULTISPECIES: S24 family peptidase [Klebsiella]HEC2117165.1 peptidase [Klebsiella oxytoca]MBG2647286.1 peptidase [Klebsiella michiganensis]MBX4801020.1 peptidase [Klebsiella michiganensis]MCC4960110.1 peptidase [Klebsiella pneumoniae]MCD7091756.1 peptidase [Klebsiella quasipneumoniae subsp. quasipneumoniae]
MTCLLSLSPDTLLLGRPIYTERIPAGFLSPAAGYEKQDLNLHEYCVRHPSVTYFLRVEGNSMEDARCLDGDVLVVDLALEPEHGSIVIAAVDNEFTVQLWGVVSHSVMRHL